MNRFEFVDYASAIRRYLPAGVIDALHLSAEGYKLWAKALLEVFQSKPER